jgi:hypothetical protein
MLYTGTKDEAKRVLFQERAGTMETVSAFFLASVCAPAGFRFRLRASTPSN